jgi:GT2 family glycosyltransferase
MSPKVSVIIPTFNGAGILDQGFEALSNQVVSFDWEVVCADNGSSDNTLERLRELSPHFPALTIVDATAERGVGYARNIGVGAAEGQYLIFVDQDDVVRPGYLTAMAEALESHEFVAARMDGETLNPGARKRILQVAGIPIAYDRFPGASGGSLGIHRSLFDWLGGFDTSVGVSDDIDLCWRAQLLGKSIEFVPDAVLMYRFRNKAGPLYRQAIRYGEAVSIMKRRYAKILQPVPSPDVRTHTPLGQLRQLLCFERGSVKETASMLGWYHGMVRVRKTEVAELSPDQFTHVPVHGRR